MLSRVNLNGAPLVRRGDGILSIGGRDRGGPGMGEGRGGPGGGSGRGVFGRFLGSGGRGGGS